MVLLSAVDGVVIRPKMESAASDKQRRVLHEQHMIVHLAQGDLFH